MLPGDFHAPGLENRLPDQKPAIDKQGNVLHDGKTWSFQKCLKSLLKHHQDELNSRQSTRGR